MLGYYHIPAIKRLIDDLPAAGNSNENELDDNRLYNRFNMVYRKDSFETIFNERIFHKLNYKGNFQEYDKNGTLTYYGYLLNK
jgi:hypothetical protein